MISQGNVWCTRFKIVSYCPTTKKPIWGVDKVYSTKDDLIREYPELVLRRHWDRFLSHVRGREYKKKYKRGDRVYETVQRHKTYKGFKFNVNVEYPSRERGGD